MPVYSMSAILVAIIIWTYRLKIIPIHSVLQHSILFELKEETVTIINCNSFCHYIKSIEKSKQLLPRKNLLRASFSNFYTFIDISCWSKPPLVYFHTAHGTILCIYCIQPFCQNSQAVGNGNR